jgi:DNA (cytosine-5)-methyltransferase 1
VQTFPDNFVFYYKNVGAGYKMIGNAVPVKMGQILAKKILADLLGLKDKTSNQTSPAQNDLNGNAVLKRMEVLIKVAGNG